MGIFDFFKKKQTYASQKIKLEDIDNIWDKKKRTQQEKNNFFDSIKNSLVV